MEFLSQKRERVRDNSDSDWLDGDFPEVKRLRESLLVFLDDSDQDPATQDLDCVIRSLQDEIFAASFSSSSSLLSDKTLISEESKPELDYLLQASDDELGLPPSISISNQEDEIETLELVVMSPMFAGVGEIWGLDDFFLNENSFEFGNSIDFQNDSDSEYVALTGVF